MTEKEKIEEKKDAKETVVKSKATSDILEKIEKMTVLELAELVKALEEKFGVSAAMPMAMQAAGAAGNGAEEEKEEEKTSFNVILKEIGANKIKVIKGFNSIVLEEL